MSHYFNLFRFPNALIPHNSMIYKRILNKYDTGIKKQDGLLLYAHVQNFQCYVP